jgi:glucose-6-phosphate isomerase
MDKPQVKLYYRNVSQEIIGTEDGISESDFQKLKQQTLPVLKEVNKQRKEGKTPYRELPYDKESAEQVKEVGERFKDGCENFVVLGIGGSALGNIALQTALNPYMYNIDSRQRTRPRIFVFDNVDPQQFGSFLNFIEDKLEKTVFNVISKSGRTAETASQFLTVRKLLLDKLGESGLKNQVITTTDTKEGTLRKITDAAGFSSLKVPDGVGGRFSVLSHVGLLSAYMGGIDIDELLEGACDMDEKVSSEDFFSNPAAVNAAVNYYYYNTGKRNSVMFPYSYALKDLADWYRQLWAESLGKSENLKGQKVNIGPTPIKALGTTDQHSQVQLYREGPNDKLFTFLEVEDFERELAIGDAPDEASELSYLAGSDMGKLINSEKKATEFALIKDKRPCLTVSFEKISPYTIGQFIYLFEVTTSITGELFGINTYNQPAVELGKEATFALMGREGFEELASEIKPVVERDSKYLI